MICEEADLFGMLEPKEKLFVTGPPNFRQSNEPKS